MLFLSILVATAAPVPAAPAQPGLSLERIFSDPPLDGAAPQQITLSPSKGGTSRVAFLRPNDKDSDVLDLWGAVLAEGGVPAASVTPSLLVATADLLGGKEQKLTEQEKMALERKRITKRGITGYQWCGDSGSRLLFPLSGDLYLVDVKAGQAPAVSRLTTDDQVPEVAPQCSPSGAQVAYVKGSDLAVLDVATKKQRTLLRGAGPDHSFGLAEFIAEEEMDRHEGFWWSHDGNSLLVFEVDESMVGKKTRAQIFSDKTTMFEQRYPAAGENNAKVSAWLVDAKRGKKVRLATPADDGYLARGGFFADDKPWVQWQSRDQRRLVLFESNAQGALRQILEEKDDAWVELHDDLHLLKDKERFLWSTEQSGRRQIVVVERATGKQTQLTHEPERVDAVLGVDEDNGVVFFSAFRDRGRNKRIFRQRLDEQTATELAPDGSDGAGNAAPPGAAAHLDVDRRPWRGAVVDDAGRFYVERASRFGVPPRTVLRDATGKRLLVLDDPDVHELRAALGGVRPMFLEVKADDGTPLNALLLAPRNVEKGKRYPVITYVYGGPGGQTVFDGWQRLQPIFLHWTQRGFGVFLVDNRGTAARDRAFDRAFFRRFGDLEVRDLFTGVAALSTVPWVDPARVGVFGWSYGGTLSTRAILDDKSPFRAAVATAPVTDWTLYDTHYTERYLGTPQAEPALYASTNLVARAKLLQRPYLLLHGTADDNVLFEHSLRLIEALEKEGKTFDLMIYPGKAHGISGKPSQLHVYKTITAFFERELKR